MDLKQLGIAIGQTMTQEIIEAATAENVPAEVLAELCERITLNAETMRRIELAMTAEKQPADDDAAQIEETEK